MSEENVLTTQAAAEWLHDQVQGESVKYWQQVLINNRREDRKPAHKVPFGTLGRAAVYRVQDLQEFAEFEKSRRLGSIKLTGRAAEVMQAFGIGEVGGSSTGRKFDFQQATPQVDEQTGELFVQMLVNNPLRVYRMTPEQAIQVGQELVETGEVAQRHKRKEQQQ